MLLVDDFDHWRQRVALILQHSQELTIVGTASDGVEAVQRAEDLQPDLVLLDIGLPKLNGLDAALQILQRSPRSKIIFLSQEISSDIVEEAFRRGANGYVAKADAATELLASIETVLSGSRFVGKRFASLVPAALPHRGMRTRHEVGFYSEELRLLDHVTEFIGAALTSRRGAIVVATTSHRNELAQRLRRIGLDTDDEISNGRLFMLDAADTLTAIMQGGMPDPDRFLNLLGSTLAQLEKTTSFEHGPTALYGECVQLLLDEGNIEAVIALERLCNRMNDLHDLEILCGYRLAERENEASHHIINGICSEHSLAHFR
ncbi:response regulator [Candidatus Korobacter versatilis]|uniref:response regulator n=1 Tax=Candidatus Korobacter versatilis TaxID=658062 RepID=UPI0002ECDB7F|nr:response regulator [Candidatus Koribacter versatilis]